LLKLDFINAFNWLTRDILLLAVSQHLPELSVVASSCYSDNSILSFEQHTIASAVGVQRGDPLCPLLFCVGTEVLVKKLKSELNSWFLDDGTIWGSADDVMTDFSTIVREGRSLGLKVNEPKCELICDDDTIIQKIQGGDSGYNARFAHVCNSVGCASWRSRITKWYIDDEIARTGTTCRSIEAAESSRRFLLTS
jgi:hypothetical protein